MVLPHADETVWPLDSLVETAKRSAALPWRTVIKDRDERKSIYAEFADTFPLHPNMIFYESMSGARIMDSPFEIFRAVDSAEEPHVATPIHVWSSRSPSVRPESIASREDVVFVRRHTPEYIYYLARAKYVIGNSTFPEYFVRRISQKYLNTWHGIGYKSLGRTSERPYGAGLAVYNMLQSTHTISPSPHMTSVMLDGFSMRNTYTGDFAETGYPRIDATINMTDARKAEVISAIGLNGGRPVVTYAPTWREDGFDVDRLSIDLSALNRLDIDLVFLGHHLMLSALPKAVLDDVIVPSSATNTNELLAVSDILISDYSSVFFDFLNTGRPVIHYLYDYSEYSKRRGLSLSLRQLPGKVAFTSDALVSAVQDSLTLETMDTENYNAAASRHCSHDDGSRATAVADWFFRSSNEKIGLITGLNRRRRVVFWGGRLGGAQSNSEFFEHLEKVAERRDIDTTLVIARSASRIPDLTKLLRRVGPQLSLVVRDDYAFGMTRDEARARSELSRGSLPETRRLYTAIYAREYRRMFGDTRFDVVRKHPELTRFWAELSKHAYK